MRNTGDWRHGSGLVQHKDALPENLGLINRAYVEVFSCLFLVQDPLLGSKGTRHACNVDMHEGKTSMHTN